MKFRHSISLLVLATATLFSATSVWADHGHGGKHGGGDDRHDEERYRHEHEVRPGSFFNDHHREVVRVYYTEHYGYGRGCPPGLAKKHNGCVPLGQARHWVVGEPVPRDVVIYPVPEPVLVQLPPPPTGHVYARIGTDIALVFRSNNVIVDIVAGF